jgi:hypothetical protein
MAEPEPGGGLFDADVADIDAEANPLRVLKLLRHLHEPTQIQAGGVLEEDEGAIGPLAKAGIQLAHPFEHAVGVCLHLALVMDDHPSDTACEAVSELPDRGPASLVENVDAAIQVHNRQARVGGHEAQDVLQLVRRVSVYLGRDTHLGEAEPGELKQSVVPGNALLEQGMNGFRHHLRRGSSRTTRFVEASSSTIRFHHSPVTGVL